MRLAVSALVLLLAAVLPACAGGPAEDGAAAVSPARQALDAQAPQWLAEHGVPSLAVAAIEDGELAWTAVYGEQSPGVPATPETLYNVASLTKPISAEAMLRLASSGAFSLDEPMAPTWVDPDVRDDPRHAALTVRTSLLHRTGFPNWRYQTENTLRFLRDPNTIPGYSGEGYEYAARFIQNKTGEPFDALARRLVFDPIGMTSTSYGRRDWFAGRVATPRGPEGNEAPRIVDGWVASDDLYTTARDYALFMIAVMKGEGLSDELARRRFTIEDDQSAEMCAHLRLSAEHCPTRMGYGLGWLVFNYPQETVVMHTGSDRGEKTLAVFAPQRRSGVVMFTNGANGRQVIGRALPLLFDHAGLVAFIQAGG